MSGDLDVDITQLGSIATSLESAREELEGLAGSAPGGIDAGLMTSTISSMLSQITTSGANVSAVLGSTAGVVRDAATYYRRADANAEATFEDIEQVVRP